MKASVKHLTCISCHYTRGGGAERGFTLIELSIVLVVIGLLVGGVFVGADMMRAAAERAQITQIEKFNQAANTFYEKFGALPGDIQPALVTQFSFTASPIRSGVVGDGDGNGELDGTNCCNAYTWAQGGELVYFWEDLSTNSHLIEGSFNTATGPHAYVTCTSASACSSFFPYGKIGNGSFVYVYSGSPTHCCGSGVGLGPNYFGLSVINSAAFGNVAQGATPPAPALTVKQAYDIDRKIDDGLPTTGNVLAQYLGPPSGVPTWSASGTSASATTCYDTSSGTAAYSVSYQNGSNVTCGISFRIQAGD